MSIITNVKSPQQMSSNLADHRVGGCVDEGVLLWAPEVRGVGGLTNEKRVSFKYQWHMIGIQLEMNWLLIGEKSCIIGERYIGCFHLLIFHI